MRALRTLRTTLVAAGATAVLATSAAGAFAAAAPEAAPVAHASAHHCKDKRVLVKTVRLADKVSVAKVYKTGKHRFEADIWAKGEKYGTLFTKGKTVHGQSNGLHVTLHPDGKVTSWVERGKPKHKHEHKHQPVAKRILVSVTTLADDVSTGKVYKLGAHHYEADIYAHGTKLDTLVAKNRAAYGQNNGLHVALQPDGRLTSWVDDDPRPEPRKTASDDRPAPLPQPDKNDDKPIVLPDNGDDKSDKGDTTVTPAPVTPDAQDAQGTPATAQAE
ncbi:hypothetical protein AQI95_13205 [Streptomyces yokosukanensis]|uniref:Peptidase n=1 Tax=Streptomyces yokosukanensis TaxID=67386 RepID=A0A101P6N7_9ACTN|nr:hypothetical protein [Streptomyces yokosukanensis]KUN05901.1 hypothetical protein AQI95_13205 [Streptomyces yokosukanensis]